MNMKNTMATGNRLSEFRVMDLFSRSFPGESFCYVNEDFMPEFLCRRQHSDEWKDFRI